MTSQNILRSSQRCLRVPTLAEDDRYHAPAFTDFSNSLSCYLQRADHSRTDSLSRSKELLTGLWVRTRSCGRNLLIWGLGGVILPFPGIKLIDMIMVAFHFVA